MVMKIFWPTNILTAFFLKRPIIAVGIGAMMVLSQAKADPTADDSTKPGTLAYHLATNAAGRAEGRYGGYADKVVLVAPTSIRLTHYADAAWSGKC